MTGRYGNPIVVSRCVQMKADDNWHCSAPLPAVCVARCYNSGFLASAVPVCDIVYRQTFDGGLRVDCKDLSF